MCGNGVVEDGEECDDGNDWDVDACLTNCTAAVCGDGFLMDGVEECDDGNDEDDDACLSSCVHATCGDGVTRSDGEQCDDANDDDTDSCTSLCRVAFCGDGFVHVGVEACDEQGSTATCDGDCTLSECGDGVRNPIAGEECDDGNNSSLDNCYVNCTAPTMLIFASSQRFQGNLGGVDGANAKCQALAVAAKLGGTFKAWLWKFNSGPPEPFYQSPGRYMRPDKVIVANNYSQLIDGPLFAPVTITEKAEPIEVGAPDDPNWQAVWTGAAPIGFHDGEVGTTCDDWTSASVKRMGLINHLDYMSEKSLGWDNNLTSFNCKVAHLSIICVQQAWHPQEPDPG